MAPLQRARYPPDPSPRGPRAALPAAAGSGYCLPGRARSQLSVRSPEDEVLRRGSLEPVFPTPRGRAGLCSGYTI